MKAGRECDVTMPRAFLMQYKRKERVDVVLQEADTTNEKKNPQIHFDEPVDLKMKPEILEMTPEVANHVPNHVVMRDDSEDEDIEISVTDESEEEEEEDEEEEEEEEEDEEGELIVGMENDLSPNARTPPIKTEIKESTKRTMYDSDDAADSSKKSKHDLDNNGSKFGDMKSAFSKPPNFPNFWLPYKNGTHRPQSQMEIDVGTYLDQKTAMTNYWLHLSKFYGMPAMGPLPAHMSIPSPPIYPPISPEMLQKRPHSMHGGFTANSKAISPHITPLPNHFFPPGFPFPYPGFLSTHALPGHSQVLREPGEIGIRQTEERMENNKLTIDSMRNKHETGDRKSPRSPNIRRHSLNSIPTPTSPIQSPSFPPSTSDFNTHTPNYPFSSPEALSHPRASSQITDTLPDGTRFAQMHAGMGFLFPPITTNGYGARRPRDPNKPPPVKKYKCDLCGKAFSRSNTLVTHRRIHTGEKPFKCEVCSRAFRQPGNLTRHRLTHTSVKPYVCVVCKKAFNRASNLHTHMRTHSNFRPFLCPYCGKGFQQKVDLKIHMYTHSNRH